ERKLAEERAERERKRRNFAPSNVEEEEVIDALRRIPKEMSYGDWLKVLMAIHSEFPNDRGIQIAEQWSSGYEGEVEQKWRSFGRGTEVTIGSLFYLAKQNGWQSSKQLVTA